MAGDGRVQPRVGQLRLGQLRLGQLGGRAVVLLAGAVLALVAVGYVATALAVRDRVPAGASVAGVRIGGLDRAAAVRLLRQRLASAPRAVAVRAGAGTAQLDRSGAGLSFDPDRAVDDLVGAPLAPAAVWRRVAGTAAGTGPAAGADTTRLAAALTGVARRLDVPARGATVAFDTSGPAVRAGAAGSVVDVAAAVRAVSTTWLGCHGSRRPARPHRRTAGDPGRGRAGRGADRAAGGVRAPHGRRRPSPGRAARPWSRSRPSCRHCG